MILTDSKKKERSNIMPLRLSLETSLTEQHSWGNYSADASPKTWDDYCAMIPEDQLAWEKKADKLGKAMLLLMNSKN